MVPLKEVTKPKPGKMKKIIGLLLVFSFLKAANVSATVYSDTLPVFDSSDALMFQTKSKGKATAGTLLLTGGTIMGGVGFGLAISGLNHLFDPNYQPKDYGSLPEILGFGGLALMAAGVILLIACKRNKRKSRIIVSHQRLSILRQNFKPKRSVSADLIINF